MTKDEFLLRTIISLAGNREFVGLDTIGNKVVLYTDDILAAASELLEEVENTLHIKF